MTFLAHRSYSVSVSFMHTLVPRQHVRTPGNVQLLSDLHYREIASCALYATVLLRTVPPRQDRAAGDRVDEARFSL